MGDQVEIKGLDVNATVVGMAEDGVVELKMGNARIELNKRQLRRVSSPEASGKSPDNSDDAPGVTVDTVKTAENTGEIDVRGTRVYEAEELVKQFVDNASLQGMTSIRIIHGTGTGALREAVRELLAKHSLVASFSAATRDRGGNGATLVDLA